MLKDNRDIAYYGLSRLSPWKLGYGGVCRFVCILASWSSGLTRDEAAGLGAVISHVTTRLKADAPLQAASSTQYAMSTHPPAHPYRLYPAYCFRASPTFNTWVKLTANDVQGLRSEPDFQGASSAVISLFSDIACSTTYLLSSQSPYSIRALSRSYCSY